jgi:hypothetical protein
VWLAQGPSRAQCGVSPYRSTNTLTAYYRSLSRPPPKPRPVQSLNRPALRCPRSKSSPIRLHGVEHTDMPRIVTPHRCADDL